MQHQNKNIKYISNKNNVMANEKRLEGRERYSIKHVISGLEQFNGYLNDAITYLSNFKDIEMSPESKLNPMKFKRHQSQYIRASIHKLTKAKQIEVMIDIYGEVLDRSADQLLQVFQATGNTDKELQIDILWDCKVLKKFIEAMKILMEDVIAKLETFQEASVINIDQLNLIIENLIDKHNACDKFLISFNYVLRVENAYLRRK